MRIRIIKQYQNHMVGERVSLPRNEAFGLIKSGYAEVDKEITNTDIQTKRLK